MESSNAVLTAVLAGDYLKGVRLYEGLPAPTAEDDRWAGLCLHNLGQHFDAKLRLASAVARGLYQANIELATLYRLTGLSGLAVSTLRTAIEGDLSRFDSVLALRELGAQAIQDGDLSRAVIHLEQAWVNGQGTFAGDSLSVPIAQLLGTVLSDLGREAEAVPYFEHALRLANPPRRVYLNAAYARSLIYLGRYAQAARMLESSGNAAHHVPVSRPVLTYYRGVLARAQGASQHAAELFSQAADLSSGSGEKQTECFARLALCALATSASDLHTARRQLARVHHLTDDARLTAYAQWREGALKAESGDRSGVDLLRRAAAGFHTLFLSREEMWVWAFVCEAHLQLNDTVRADEALDRAADLRFSLGEGAPMAVELRYLSRTLAHLASLPEDRYSRIFWTDFQSVHGAVSTTVEVLTLGSSQIKVAGVGVRLDLSRSVELLVYFLDHPGVRLEQVQLDLFPEVEHRTSKSYIHQVRRELERVVPGLRIPYNRLARTYQVSCPEIEVRWDVADLRRTLNAHCGINALEMLSRCGGPFLPKAEGSWAGTVRRELQRWIVQVGLEMLDEWYVRGEHTKCLALASRLIDIEPLDEGLNEFLLKTTLIVEGQGAARQAYRRIRERYEDEYGEVPPNLQKYQAQINNVN